MKKLLLLSAILISFVPGIFAQNTSKDAIKAKIKLAYEYFSNGTSSKYGDVMTEDYIEHTPVPGQKPGLAGITEEFEKFRIAYPDAKFEVKDIILQNDKAAVLLRLTGTNTGEYFGMKPTGKKIDIMGVDYLKFRGDKASEHWGFVEEIKLMGQLGLMPEMTHDQKKDTK
jgi:predicted ester cyclase